MCMRAILGPIVMVVWLVITDSLRDVAMATNSLCSTFPTRASAKNNRQPACQQNESSISLFLVSLNEL